jgi:choline dehydrogenase-like flavoprotein
MSRRVDVVIVGSGPIGSAFARPIGERRPQTSILMVDAGPKLTEPPGMNVRNIVDPDERLQAQALSQGRAPVRAALARAGERPAVVARPGTHLVRQYEPGASEQDGMPAAAMSTNIGGMAAHWTCACPAAADSERIAYLDQARLAAAEDEARRLLSVTTGGFPAGAAATAVRTALGRAFAELLGPGRRVGPMPLACTPVQDGRPLWSGADTVLYGLTLDRGAYRFELREQTLCRRLLVDGGRVRGVELEDLASGASEVVEAAVVVVAADALRTPQLLWTSGIRPVALGRHLNDQPQVIAAAYVPTNEPAAAGNGDPAAAHGPLATESGRDMLTGVSWVPFSEPDHPFHGQVMQLDASPVDLGVPDGSGAVVGLGWFCAKDVQADDRVEFSETQKDAYGMPAMRIHYRLTARDRQNIDEAMAHQRRAAEALGDFIPNGHPSLLPAGSSLHYQGTVRMGDDGGEASVCDASSRVWGFENLYVGGNGVIPTATACNPTLTSVALAALATDNLLGRL